MSSNNPHILVASNDAGGAEVLSAWLRKNPQENITFCLYGPAVNIFQKKIETPVTISEEEAVEKIKAGNFDQMLTGTSWENLLELRLIKEAKKYGLYTKTFIDHWVNHPSRFGSSDEWKNNIPDEVVCGDEYCKNICLNDGFPESVLKVYPNEYFNEIIEDAKSYQIEPQVNSILYLCEPIAPHEEAEAKSSYGEQASFNEFTMMKRFFEQLENSATKPTSITIRKHPSEKIEKYFEVTKPYSERFNINWSEGTSLTEDILSSETIVGVETMALVVGVLLKKKPFTMLYENDHKKCPLPFKEIQSFEYYGR